MSLKEVTELLKDLIESNKQLTLRLKMIEIELNYIKENLPGRITKIIEKTEQFDKKVSQKYIKELLSKKLASGSTYQKGSMDEILIQKFLEKQTNLEDNRDTLEGLKNSVQEGIMNLKVYIYNEFFGGKGNEKDNKEFIRTIAKEQLEKLQICKMSYIQD